MPARSRGPDLLVDTSVAVALVVADHAHHDDASQAVGSRRLGLAGHAAFETFSVLTRLPPPARRDPATVAELLRENFPETRFLTETRAAALIDDLVVDGISGGSVYDALVGAVASEQRVVLGTRDHRAVETYRALGVAFELIG